LATGTQRVAGNGRANCPGNRPCPGTIWDLTGPTPEAARSRERWPGSPTPVWASRSPRTQPDRGSARRFRGIGAWQPLQQAGRLHPEL